MAFLLSLVALIGDLVGALFGCSYTLLWLRLGAGFMPKACRGVAAPQLLVCSLKWRCDGPLLVTQQGPRLRFSN